MFRRLLSSFLVLAGLGISTSLINAATDDPRDTTGIVVNSAGEPVADATVRMTLLTFDENTPPGPAGSQAQPVQQLIQKTTDEQGQFRVSYIAHGIAAISASKEPHTQSLTTATLPAQNLRLELPAKGGTITGTVRNMTTGQPVADANLTALPIADVRVNSGLNGSPSNWGLPGTTVYARADGAGNFVIDQLPVSKVRIIVTAPDVVAVDPLLTVKLDSTDKPVQIDIGVYPGHTLEGRVINRDTGEPIPGANVSVGFGSVTTGGAAHVTANPKNTAMADSAGKYLIEKLKPSPVSYKGYNDAKEATLDFMTVSASAPGFKRERYTPTAAKSFDKDSLRITHDFELTPQ